MGTEGAGTEADRAAAVELVADLLQAVTRSKRAPAALAAQVHISRSTISRWGKGAIPRTFHAQLLGSTVGLRMEWAPSNRGWPGAERPYRPDSPTELAMVGRSHARGLLDQDVGGLYPAMLDARLLADEARWARIYVKRWTLDDCPGDRYTWSAFEHGPEVQAPGGASGQRRRYLSSPLSTAVFIGRCLGLELSWRQRSDPHRVRPWEVQHPPLPRNSTGALKQAKLRDREAQLW